MPFFDIDHLKLYYEDYWTNCRVPLIFLHGVMASSQIWISQVEYFKDTRRVVIFDLRGHGRSDKPRGKYSITQFSNDLYSVMDGLNIEKAIISGHSMGGMTALQFTLDHQQKVEKLILRDTTPQSSYSVRRRLVFLISQLALSIAYEAFMKYYISSVFRQDCPKAERETALESVLQNPRHVVKSCFSTIQHFDLHTELDKIRFRGFQRATLLFSSTTPLVRVASIQEPQLRSPLSSGPLH